MVSFTARAILPKQKFGDKKWLDAIAQAQKDKTVPDVLKLFDKTISGWKNKPNFSSKQTVSPSRISIHIGIETLGGANDIYNLVNFGSPPHIITSKKRGGFLRFQSGYKAATVPGKLMSSASNRFGEWWAASQVDHPGFPARSFDQTILDEYESIFADDMQDAINKIAKS